MSNSPEPRRARPWRPVILIALVIVLLFFSALSWARFGLAFANGNFYNLETGLPLSIYLAVSGAVWGVTSLAAAIGNWYRKSWALLLTGIGAVAFTAWFWVERLLLKRTSLATINWLYDAIFNLIVLVFILSTVFAVYPYPSPRPPKGK